MSRDEGANWAHRLILEDGPGVFCYPAVIRSSDVTIHVVYTHDRKAIRHVELTEVDLLEFRATG